MTCNACTTGCTSCTGPGLDSCSECTTGYTLKSPSTCIKCSSSCLTCSDGSDTNCQQCAKDYFLDGFSCVSTCSGSQFGDADTAPDNPVCESCYHTCQRCTGDQHYMCLECKEGYYWDPMSNDCKTECHKNPNMFFNYYEIEDTKQCKLSCAVDGTCEICSTKCKTCYGEKNN